MADHAADHVHVIKSTAEWQLKLQEATSSKKLVVVDFTAVWCGPCKAIAPHFAELSKKHPDILFLKVDVDLLPDITTQWDVSGMPTFVFILEDKELDRIVGANKDGLLSKIVQYRQAVA